ncbi:MAG: DegT/DnrJ/EryC1/StrS family aminotransferase [Nitrososphaerota archaeon]|nr:DegT/DnrJ/EryC1/StrS family aminotransferase [Nitrososphaerota archaeon]
MRYLATAGIQSLIHYPVPVHRQESYRTRLKRGRDLPVTEEASQKVLSLPMFPELRDDEIQTVCSEAKSFHRR